MFLRSCRGQHNARNAIPERYPHDKGFKTARERQKNPTNISFDFNYDFNQQAKGQTNSVGRSSFSDEADVGSLMMGSIDFSAHNFDINGASGSSDESVSQSPVCLTVEQYVYDDIEFRK